MVKNKLFRAITKFLAYSSLLAIFFAHLALTDISHNKEPDLSAEWLIVRVTFFIIITFIISVLVTLKRIK